VTVSWAAVTDVIVIAKTTPSARRSFFSIVNFMQLLRDIGLRAGVGGATLRLIARRAARSVGVDFELFDQAAKLGRGLH
jgi:hypothetical protein